MLLAEAFVGSYGDWRRLRMEQAVFGVRGMTVDSFPAGAHKDTAARRP
jgi:hypothetical protein